MAGNLDVEIVRRELTALNQRRALPGNADHWQLVKSELMELPRTAVDYWRGVVADSPPGSPPFPPRSGAPRGARSSSWRRSSGGSGIAGLQRLATLGPAGGSSVGIALEALRRSLPGLLPAAFWLLVAWSVGLASRPTWLLGCALGLWPLVVFVLRAEPVRGRAPRSSASAAPVARVAAGGPGGRCRPWRAGAAGRRRADAAFGRRSRRGASGSSRSPSPRSAPGCCATSCWARCPTGRRSRRGSAPPRRRQLRGARAAAAGSGPGPRRLDQSRLGDRGSGRRAFLAVAVLALLLCGVLRDLARRPGAPPWRRGRRRRPRPVGDHPRRATGWPWSLVVVGAAWLLASLYLRGTAATAAFWFVAVACALPFVLQPVQTLVAAFLRDRPRTAAGRLDQRPGDLHRSRHPRPADHRQRAGAGLGARLRPRGARHAATRWRPGSCGRRSTSRRSCWWPISCGIWPAPRSTAGCRWRRRPIRPRPTRRAARRGCARCCRSCATCCWW